MKSTLNALLIVSLLVALVSPVHADENPARAVARHCKTELKTYCADVTPGRGRILSCLYAYSDQASDKCEEVVLDAVEQVKLMTAAISFVQGECAEDFEQFCKDVVPGEGRVIRCLEENDEKVSRKCKLALKDVGLKD